MDSQQQFTIFLLIMSLCVPAYAFIAGFKRLGFIDAVKITALSIIPSFGFFFLCVFAIAI